MFGRGRTRLQPAYVEDVAEAVAIALQPTLARPITFECAGPHVYSYEELLKVVAHEADIRPILIPIPFAAWHALAWIAESFPGPPIARNQVELMQIDNVSSPQMPGFADLGISPRSIEEILQEMLRQP
jgi:NADH dehydrogenase